MKANERLISVLVDEKLHEALRARAKRNGRSMGREARIIIETALAREEARVPITAELDAEIADKLTALADKQGISFEALCEKVVTDAVA